MFVVKQRNSNQFDVVADYRTENDQTDEVCCTDYTFSSPALPSRMLQHWLYIFKTVPKSTFAIACTSKYFVEHTRTTECEAAVCVQLHPWGASWLGKMKESKYQTLNVA